MGLPEERHTDRRVVSSRENKRYPFLRKRRKFVNQHNNRQKYVIIVNNIIWQHDDKSRGINNGMLIPSGIIV